MKNLYFIFILILLLSACEKKKSFETRKIVFEYDYINYAWGYQHKGWLVDTNGVVRLHQSADEHETWKLADNSGYISENDLQHNYDLSDTVIYNLDPSEVKGKITLLNSISENDLSEKSHPMADAGVGSLYGYVWDKNVQKYKRIFLAQSGDIAQVNNNANAVILKNWLIDKGEHQIKYFYWYY